MVKGKAKYRLIDEKVRFFVAPPVEEINNSKVRLRSLLFFDLSNVLTVDILVVSLPMRRATFCLGPHSLLRSCCYSLPPTSGLSLDITAISYSIYT